MDEFVVIMKSLGAKITISAGTLAGLIVGLFTLNRKVDERIDKRARDVAIDEVVVQHDQCRAERTQLIKECFENNPRLMRMETNIENIGKDLDRLLKLHLNGGGRN